MSRVVVACLLANQLVLDHLFFREKDLGIVDPAFRESALKSLAVAGLTEPLVKALLPIATRVVIHEWLRDELAQGAPRREIVNVLTARLKELGDTRRPKTSRNLVEVIR